MTTDVKLNLTIQYDKQTREIFTEIFKHSPTIPHRTIMAFTSHNN